ncbi:MAG TPA: 1-acyl-sn-glycerol-3-phosphate acyltransferase [Thermoanaerobaculia bacterium]|nr:1-acyl-sn-glycerol-3-phosphate acyltransferase [Thermoanaerobaculia bacterium]
MALDPRTATSKLWRLFCRGVVRVFYRRVEVLRGGRLPARGPVILCANHLNALADPIILQSVAPYPLHPLARSGLFRNPLMWPLLWLARAIPVSRRPAGADADPTRNDAAFRRAAEVLGSGGAILIFPEGESHSDPRLKPLKTGAARIAMAALRDRAVETPLVPVSLIFTRRGRFRSSVLVQVGESIHVRRPRDAADPASAGRDSEMRESGVHEPEIHEPEIREAEIREAEIRALTAAVEAGLRAITFNVDSWADLDFLNRLDRFYRLRRGRRPQQRRLSRRFRALQRMVAVHRGLRERAPHRIEAVRRRLRRFEALCELLGARGYDLEVERRPGRFAIHLLAILLPALLALPVTAAGLVTSGPPFFLTRWLGPRLARRADQYDTSKILLGLALFALWWGAQVAWVWRLAGWPWALGWLAALGPMAAVAWGFARSRRRIAEELRAFVVLRSRRDAREYLQARREELEVAIAELARLAKRLPEGELDLVS